MFLKKCSHPKTKLSSYLLNFYLLLPFQSKLESQNQTMAKFEEVEIILLLLMKYNSN